MKLELDKKRKEKKRKGIRIERLGNTYLYLVSCMSAASIIAGAI